MSRFRYAVFVGLYCIVSGASALDVPEKTAFDVRIRYVNYNLKDVVQVDTVVGITTHIAIEEGEQYLTHAFGDPKAWEFTYKANHYFIRPIAQFADSNLTLVTDRRTYYFKLNYHDSRSAPTMYGVTFTYPDTKETRAQVIEKKAEVERGFGMQRTPSNLAYSMAGDFDIAPVNAWDNNEFTYFKFPGNRDVPGIYMVDVDGNESIVNRTTEGNANEIVVVHKVGAKWILRLGSRALAVYNDAFDANGVANSTGTISPVVKRVIKGGE